MGKNVLLIIFSLALLMMHAGCGSKAEEAIPEPGIKQESAEPSQAEQKQMAEDTPEMTELRMMIDGTEVDVTWEDNESVKAIRELAASGGLEINMSMYGGFEQVGPIGQSIPANDQQITTEAGDIVLYSGNQVVVFYGYNSWAYTRLGKVTGKTADEMKELLGNGDIKLRFVVD